MSTPVRAPLRATQEALNLLETEVRDAVRREGLDPASDAGRAQELIDRAVRDYEDRAASGTLPELGDPAEARRFLVDSITGFGPIQPYLDDPTIEEIYINSPDRGISPSWRVV